VQKDMTSSSGHSGAGYRYLAVTMALSLSLLISVLDIAAYLMRGGRGEGGPAVLGPVFAASMITITAVFLVLWFSAVGPLGKVLRLDLTRLAVAFAAFILVIYTLWVIHSEIKYGSFPGDLRISVMAVGTAGTALLFARLIYEMFCIVPMKAVVIPARVSAVAAFILLLVSLGSVAIGGKGSICQADFKAVRGHALKKVILISIDTLRADALGCYNGKSDATEHMDSFAGDGVVFKRAFAPAPWTLPSMSSIMTGLPPMVHGVVDPKNKLPASLMTLAEYMQKEGYCTCGTGNSIFLEKRYNFAQGFQEYNFPQEEKISLLGDKVLRRLFDRRPNRSLTTPEITDKSIKWVEAHTDDDFFLWLHYFDPHLPYDIPPEYHPKAVPPSAKVGYGLPLRELSMVLSGALTFSQEEQQWIRELYHSEVRYVDDNVGRLLTRLKELAIYDESLIIITSDHGEEFWERDNLGHGRTLYNELLSVPLIVKLPAAFGHVAEVEVPVSTEAVAPTILELCNTGYDSKAMARTSLSALWRIGSAAPKEELLVATRIPNLYRQYISAYYDGHKYISSENGKEELYDLAKDPGEQVNIAGANRKRLDQLKEMLEQYRQNILLLQNRNKTNAGEEAVLDEETIRKLKSLGYMH